MPLTDTDAGQAFHHLVRLTPGGQHLLEHIEDGPWTFVSVTYTRNPQPLAFRAMAAYPGREAVHLTSDDVLAEQTLYLLPNYPCQLVRWYEDGDLELSYTATYPVWATRPEGERPWVAALLAAVLYPEPEEAAATLPDTEVAYSALLAHLQNLVADTGGQVPGGAARLHRQIAMFIDAFTAAALTPAHGVA